MQPVAFGLSAALLWGLAALALASAARRSPTIHAFALWVLLYQTVIALIAASLAVSDITWSAREVAIACFAGVFEALGMVAYGWALRKGNVGTAAGLLSLEGAIAASLAFLTGEQLTILGGGGIVLAAVGGLIVALPAGRYLWGGGTGHAFTAALMFGIALWLVGIGDLDPPVTLFLLSAIAALLVGIFTHGRGTGWRSLSRGIHAVLFASAALGIGGFLLYTLGARDSSVAITAVLAAQFSVFAVVGGYFLWNERLSKTQLAGLLTLLAGVSALAVGATE